MDGVAADMTATCQVCGGQATGYEFWRDFEEVGELEELWPGGPVVEVRTPFIRQRPTASHIRLDPCGHEQPRPDEVRFIVRTMPPTVRPRMFDVRPDMFAIEDQPPPNGPPRMLAAYRRLIRKWGERELRRRS